VEILTFPIGLVVGLLPVVTNLGPGGAPATVLLDGHPACMVTTAVPRCTVDLGAGLKVHLLELVRTDSGGHVMERAMRWINRPGEAAEIFTNLDCAGGGVPCRLEFGWGHPRRKDPIRVSVSVNGVLIADGRPRDLVLPATAPDRASVINVEALFADGRRVERSVLLSGEASEGVTTQLTAVPLVVGDGVSPPTSIGGYHIRALERGPASIATVGAPEVLRVVGGQFMRAHSDASYEPALLARLEGRLGGLRSFTFVSPTKDLRRTDLPVEGREVGDAVSKLLAVLGAKTTANEGATVRVADAVALAALAVGANPGPRAVVLVLGRNGAPDRSVFACAEVQRYLSEIMVPLVVWRTAPRVGDAWPRGLHVTSLAEYDSALQQLDDFLDSQRVAWVEGEIHPGLFDPGLPDGVHLAGRGTPVAAPSEVHSTPPALARPRIQPGVPTTAEREAQRTTASRSVHEPTPATAGAAAAISEHVNVTAVRVPVQIRTVRGRPLPALSPLDMEVREDGRAAKVLALEPLGAPVDVTSRGSPPVAVHRGTEERQPGSVSSVVVYAIPTLCNRGNLARIFRALARERPELRSVGPMSLVVADPHPRLIARDEDGGDAVERALSHEAERPRGWSDIVTIRRDFLALVEGGPAGHVGALSAEATRLADESRYGGRLATAQASMREERAVIDRAFGELVAWGRTNRPRHGGVMLLAIDGFDEDPGEFYSALVQPGADMEDRGAYQSAEAEFQSYRLETMLESSAGALAEAGWQVFLFDAGTAGTGGFAGAAEFAGRERFRSFLGSNPEAGAAAEPMTLVLHPREALERIAGATGGAVIALSDAGKSLANSLAGSYLLTYQVDRPADGRPHTIGVSCTLPEVSVAAPKQIFAGTPASEAYVLVRDALSNPSGGDLPVQLSVSLKSVSEERMRGELVARVDLGSLKAALEHLGEVRVRVSVAVEIEGEEPFVTHDVKEIRGNANGTRWVYEAPMQWPARARRVAVRVEELASGAWGAAVVELPRPK
jgi:hypothetical protein